MRKTKTTPEKTPKLAALNKLFPAVHLIITLLFSLVAVSLIGFAAAELWSGLFPGEAKELSLRINSVLEALAILTVAVAALELAQTILEEEVLRSAQMSAPTRVRRFLSRFLVVLVVALSIETLVLVIDFGHGKPEHLPYAAYVGLTAAAMLIAWGVFIYMNRSAEELEPEAMEQAKREDAKIE